MQAAHDPLLGRVLAGRYQLASVLGEGSSARVYRARQLTLGRWVAVKVLHPEQRDRPEVRARFRLEAHVGALLAHPNVVRVLDYGEDHGVPWLATEYLGGADLFDVVHGEGPMSSRRIARLMYQVASALAHAHAHGVVHRDLKPENMRVVRDGGDEQIKLYDFGTAQVAGLRFPGVVDANVVVGTPDYMPPEQAAARPVDARSDLYACGVVMYLLATGRLPFAGAAPEDLARQHVAARPVRPSVVRPDLDPRLEQVILACLAKRPADRPSSARALMDALAPVARRSAAPAAHGAAAPAAHGAPAAPAKAPVLAAKTAPAPVVAIPRPPRRWLLAGACAVAAAVALFASERLSRARAAELSPVGSFDALGAPATPVMPAAPASAVEAGVPDAASTPEPMTQ